jgi:hypothetical protein
MKIRLLRKLGQNPIGAVIDRTAPEAEQLIRQNFAVHAPHDDAQAQPAEDTEPDGDGDDSDSDSEGDENTGGQNTGPSAADLRAHAERLQISTSGNKKQLSERIEQHIAEHGDQPAPAN